MSTERDRAERKQQSENLKFRSALNNGYAVLEGEKYTNSVIAFTFEEAVDLQIQRLEGPGSRIRPTEIERVDKIEAELLQAVEQVKEIPPEVFMNRRPDKDVNQEE